MAADQRIIDSDRRLVTKASLGDSLDRLWRVIDSRRGADPGTSYTAKLLARGRHKAAQKLGEEAVEAVIEAARHDNAALIGESADPLYPLLVAGAASIASDSLHGISRHGVEGNSIMPPSSPLSGRRRSNTAPSLRLSQNTAP